MGVIGDGKTILLDTNCFIYYFEDNPNYSDKLENVFINIQDGNNTQSELFPAFCSVYFLSVFTKEGENHPLIVLLLNNPLSFTYLVHIRFREPIIQI